MINRMKHPLAALRCALILVLLSLGFGIAALPACAQGSSQDEPFSSVGAALRQQTAPAPGGVQASALKPALTASLPQGNVTSRPGPEITIAEFQRALNGSAVTPATIARATPPTFTESLVNYAEAGVNGVQERTETVDHVLSTLEKSNAIDKYLSATYKVPGRNLATPPRIALLQKEIAKEVPASGILKKVQVVGYVLDAVDIGLKVTSSYQTEGIAQAHRTAITETLAYGAGILGGMAGGHLGLIAGGALVAAIGVVTGPVSIPVAAAILIGSELAGSIAGSKLASAGTSKLVGSLIKDVPISKIFETLGKGAEMTMLPGVGTLVGSLLSKYGQSIDSLDARQKQERLAAQANAPPAQGSASPTPAAALGNNPFQSVAAALKTPNPRPNSAPGATPPAAAAVKPALQSRPPTPPFSASPQGVPLAGGAPGAFSGSGVQSALWEPAAKNPQSPSRYNGLNEGVVTNILRNDPRLGSQVEIFTTDAAGNLWTQRISNLGQLKVLPGEVVKPGQALGTGVGSGSAFQGGSAKGAVIHTELFRNGQLVNPLSGAAVASGASQLPNYQSTVTRYGTKIQSIQSHATTAGGSQKLNTGKGGGNSKVSDLEDTEYKRILQKIMQPSGPAK